MVPRGPGQAVLDMPRPFIMVAPNGARRDRTDHPALPVTTDQIVATALACHAAGADALHLHVRDDQGRHTLDPGRYRETLNELSAVLPEMPVQITTELAGIFDVATQLRCLADLRPHWASIAPREIARAPDLVARVYATCAAQGIRVQHILYDQDDVALLADWTRRGLVRPDQSEVIFVLGRYRTGQIADPADLATFREAMERSPTWMLCAFGPREHDCLLEAARRGGQLRVGFENSLTAPDGQPHTDNASSVAALRRLLERNLP